MWHKLFSAQTKVLSQLDAVLREALQIYNFQHCLSTSNRILIHHNTLMWLNGFRSQRRVLTANNLALMAFVLMKQHDGGAREVIKTVSLVFSCG